MGTKTFSMFWKEFLKIIGFDFIIFFRSIVYTSIDSAKDLIENNPTIIMHLYSVYAVATTEDGDSK